MSLWHSIFSETNTTGHEAACLIILAAFMPALLCSVQSFITSHAACKVIYVKVRQFDVIVSAETQRAIFHVNLKIKSR